MHIPMSERRCFSNLSIGILILTWCTIWYVIPVSAAVPNVGAAQNTLDQFTNRTGAPTKSLLEQTAIGIQTVLAVSGMIFFILALYGGITWMTAQGDEDRVRRGRNAIVAATIGLVVVLGAYGIASFITLTLVDQINSPS